MALSGILFDKDGTLVDFDLTWGRATHAVMGRLAGDDAARHDALAALMHFTRDTRRFAATSPMIAGSMAEVIAIWGEGLGRSDHLTLARELRDAFATETLVALTPIGDPAAVLEILRRQGLRLGLATNDGEASAHRQLEALGLGRYLEFVAGYDSGHGGKPEPGMVLAFAAAIGAEPGQVALVGDTLHDLHAARAAGALAIAVLTGPVGREVLAPWADHVIDTIADLPALVAALA